MDATFDMANKRFLCTVVAMGVVVVLVVVVVVVVVDSVHRALV